MLKFRCFHAPFFMPDLNIGHFLFTPLNNNIINRNMNRLFFRIYIRVFEPTRDGYSALKKLKMNSFEVLIDGMGIVKSKSVCHV